VSHILDRLLHLRALLEDVSRAELERKLQHRARIEEAQRREQTISLQLRNKSLTLILDNTDMAPAEDKSHLHPERSHLRRFAEYDRRASDERRDRLVGIAAEGNVQVQKAQREFFMRRDEARSLETLIRNMKAQVELEQNRRDQQRLDDWFVAKHSQNRRKRTESGQS
jgi:hypothetical protein